MVLAVQHPSGIPEKIVRKVVARRGRLHAFDSLDPKSTALVVIDLDEATVQGDETAQRMASSVNTLATFYRIFGDVRPSGEVIALLGSGA